VNACDETRSTMSEVWFQRAANRLRPRVSGSCNHADGMWPWRSPPGDRHAPRDGRHRNRCRGHVLRGGSGMRDARRQTERAGPGSRCGRSQWPRPCAGRAHAHRRPPRLLRRRDDVHGRSRPHERRAAPQVAARGTRRSRQHRVRRSLPRACPVVKVAEPIPIRSGEVAHFGLRELDLTSQVRARARRWLRDRAGVGEREPPRDGVLADEAGGSLSWPGSNNSARVTLSARATPTRVAAVGFVRAPSMSCQCFPSSLAPSAACSCVSLRSSRSARTRFPS